MRLGTTASCWLIQPSCTIIWAQSANTRLTLSQSLTISGQYRRTISTKVRSWSQPFRWCLSRLKIFPFYASLLAQAMALSCMETFKLVLLQICLAQLKLWSGCHVAAVVAFLRCRFSRVMSFSFAFWSAPLIRCIRLWDRKNSTESLISKRH